MAKYCKPTATVIRFSDIDVLTVSNFDAIITDGGWDSFFNGGAK